jgi:hypothetical protein
MVQLWVKEDGVFAFCVLCAVYRLFTRGHKESMFLQFGGGEQNAFMFSCVRSCGRLFVHVVVCSASWILVLNRRHDASRSPRGAREGLPYYVIPPARPAVESRGDRVGGR